MYMSVNLGKDTNETSHDLAEAIVQELFKSVSSSMETDTPTQKTHHQLSAQPSNSNTSDLEAIPELKHGNGSDCDIRQPHTGIYAIRSRSNFFSVFI